MMKRNKVIFLLVLLLAAIMLVVKPQVNVSASSATTKTYTLDYKGNFVTTQDAYLPQTTFTSFGLSSPDDLVVSQQGIVFISDTGNKRILLVDAKSGEVVKEIKSFLVEGVSTKFKKPMGIYILSQANVYGVIGDLLYVADADASTVYIFNEDLACIKTIKKPTSILFNNREFHPQKIATDNGGNMYIIGEGINEGIIQLSIEGEFLGYFATNKVKLTFKQQLQEWLYTDAQKDKLPSKNPPVFSNLYCDTSGIVYSTTVSQSDNQRHVQKHNTAGKNLFTKYSGISSHSMIDIYTNATGITYAVSQYGDIYVYTQQGEFIYAFGGGGGISTPDISGVFKRVSAIAVDNDENIWILDQEKEIIQTFSPTDYALNIYSAISAYLKSDYTTSIQIWKEVLELNQMSNIAHNNLGLNYLYSQQYEQAMEHLKISNNKSDYSKAYWEVRNIWLQGNIAWMIITLLSIIVVVFILKKVNKKTAFLAPVQKNIKRVREIPIISEYLAMFKIARKPELTFYDLKHEKTGSLRGAWLILLTIFITYMIYITSQGFIYQYNDLVDINFVSVIIGFIAIVFSVIICNYLVTSITDGNGTIKQIFKLLMYSLAPVIVGMLMVVILSHFMTEQEAFFLDIIMVITIFWSVILVALGMQEIHGYNLKQLIVSVLLTVLLLIIVVLVLLIIFVLSQDLIDFIKLIIQEVMRNVKG